MKNIFLLFIACCCLMGCNSVPQAYVLQNTENGDKITLGNVTTPEDFQLLMGKAHRVEKEPNPDPEAAPPWTLLVYNGRRVEFIGDYIAGITIASEGWQINGIGVGDSLDEVKAQYKYAGKSERGDADLFIFKENPTDDVLYTKSDENGVITEVGFGSPVL